MELTEIQKEQIIGLVKHELNYREKLPDNDQWGRGWDNGYREGYVAAAEELLRVLGYELSVSGCGCKKEATIEEAR